MGDGDEKAHQDLCKRRASYPLPVGKRPKSSVALLHPIACRTKFYVFLAA
jgi:hypothetical protein